MDRPKLAFVTPGSFPVPSPTSSSVERVVVETAKRLAGFADVTVYGIASSGQATRQVIDGVTYIRFRCRKGYMAGVIRHLSKSGMQLVQVENRPRHARAIKQALPGMPVWLSLHSLTFIDPAKIGTGELEDCFRHADRIMVNSEFLRGEVTRLVPSQADKIVVNHLGVDPDRFKSRWSAEGSRVRNAMRRRYGYRGKKVLLYAGRLLPQKGVHRLLQAFPTIAAAQPSARLVIVGSAFYRLRRQTPYVRKLHRLAARKSIRNRVRFVPFVPHTRMANWFQMADIAVVPSISKEAFGLVNVEAMATGLPVVAAHTGGMVEIIDHGVNGFLVDADRTDALADAILRLLNDQELRRSVGEAAIRSVLERFTWQHTAERWYSLASQTGLGCGWP